MPAIQVALTTALDTHGIGTRRAGRGSTGEGVRHSKDQVADGERTVKTRTQGLDMSRTHTTNEGSDTNGTAIKFAE